MKNNNCLSIDMFKCLEIIEIKDLFSSCTFAVFLMFRNLRIRISLKVIQHKKKK